MYTIFRLERPHKTRKIGLGPYQYNSLNLYDELHRIHSYDNKNRLNYSDDFCANNFDMDLSFACPTAIKLIEWFDDLLELAYNDGLKIARYKVTNITISNSKKQCVFSKNDIIEKQYLSLEEFYKQNINKL